MIWFMIYTPILPFKLSGKWYWLKKIKITYLTNDDGKHIPIKTEIFKK